MNSLRIIAIVGLMSLVTGCTSATLGVIKGTVVIMSLAYAVCTVSEQKNSHPSHASNLQPAVSQQIPYQPARTVAQQPSVDISSLLNSAMISYQQFEYQDVIKITSHGLSAIATHDNRARLLVLRGAARYLLNDVKQAESDFRAAKQEGAQSIAMDSKIFPQDIIEFFNKSK